jgi:Family of unknown function (DUF6247)
MTTEVTQDRRLPLAERIAYAREHVPEEHRQGFEDALREATEQALATGDYRALDDVAEAWWRAARFEHLGSSELKRLLGMIRDGRTEELMAEFHPVDVDAMLREHSQP